MPEQNSATPEDLQAMFDRPSAVEPEHTVPDTLDTYDQTTELPVVPAEQGTDDSATVEQEADVEATAELPVVGAERPHEAPENAEQTEARKQLEAYNAKMLHHVAEQPDGAWAPLRLNVPEADKPRHQAEELVDDASVHNKTLDDLIHTSNAVIMRDDLAGGEKQGMRLFKGTLEGKDIFFEEHLVQREVVSDTGESETVLERTLFAVNAGTAEGAMQGLRQPEIDDSIDTPDAAETGAEPSLAEQRERLREINTEHAKQLDESGLLDKVVRQLHNKAHKLDQLDRLRNGQPLEDTDQQAIERQANTIAASAEYERYGITHQVRSDLSELYGVSQDAYNIVYVGKTVVDEFGDVTIRPNAGFSEEDVSQVRAMADRLEELRHNGTLPDLTENNAQVENPSKEVAERPVDELADIRFDQAEREAEEAARLAHMKETGATEEQLETYKQNLAAMKQAELERGRVFLDYEAYVQFKELSRADDRLDMGLETGLEQGEPVHIPRDTGDIEEWTFMGIDRTTGKGVVAVKDASGHRMTKPYEIKDLKRAAQNYDTE